VDIRERVVLQMDEGDADARHPEQPGHHQQDEAQGARRSRLVEGSHPRHRSRAGHRHSVPGSPSPLAHSYGADA
jgi:hypothetical protein